MVSKYDIFYVIALKGETKISDIIKDLNKTNEDYKTIFNQIVKLGREKYIERGKTIKVVHNEKSKKLFELITFCINNGINYNLVFSKTMLGFLLNAARKEFFTINDIKIHPQTFRLYVDALSDYGFLFIYSRKPLRCKLLRHHFFIDLTRFFGKKIQFYAPKRHIFINEIRHELKVYKKNLRIHPSLIRDAESRKKAKFIYSSLNLEGNPLTLPETQQLILDNVFPKTHDMTRIEEVTNYKKAVDLMIQNSKNKVRLSLSLIIDYHKIAMSHMAQAGQIRAQNVIIKNNPRFKTSDWHSINQKLNSLMVKYDMFESKKNSIEELIDFSAFFHNEFQRIHPFIDGNSRTARLLMYHILRSHGIIIIDLPLGYFDLYLDLTKRSASRNDKTFSYLIEEIIFMNLKKINESGYK